MKEARVQTDFGEIRITFQTTDELNAALQELEQQVAAIKEVADKIKPPVLHTPKLGYEKFYRFSPNGSLELLFIPKKRNEAVALVLYAFHPEPVSAAEIERITGIKEVTRRVLSLTQNKDHFCKVGDKYGLTFEGLQMVNERLGQNFVNRTESDDVEQTEPEQTE